MNVVIPNAERKAALLSIAGLVALTAALCASEVWTHPLRAREYLIQIGLGAAVGGISGAVFGYVAWLGVTSVQRLTAACGIGATQVASVEASETRSWPHGQPTAPRPQNSLT